LYNPRENQFFFSFLTQHIPLRFRKTYMLDPSNNNSSNADSYINRLDEIRLKLKSNKDNNEFRLPCVHLRAQIRTLNVLSI